MPPRALKTVTASAVEAGEQPEVQDIAEAAEPTGPKRFIKIFTSPTCGPCKRYKPLLLEEAEKRGVEVIQVELADDTREEFEALGIRQVPVTVVFEGDKEVSRLMGAPANIVPQMDNWGF